MVAETKLSILDNFAINNWNRFLLYIGGVILILSMFLKPEGIEINQLRAFSIKTINLGLFVWILLKIIDKEILLTKGIKSEENIRNWVRRSYLINFCGLGYWILYILPIIK